MKNYIVGAIIGGIAGSIITYIYVSKIMRRELEERLKLTRFNNECNNRS